MERRSYRFSGRVQSVGFRYTALQAARRLELTGWVSNRADGTVEAQVQGDAANLNRFPGTIAALNRWIRLDKTEWSRIPVQAEEKTFTVRGY